MANPKLLHRTIALYGGAAEKQGGCTTARSNGHGHRTRCCSCQICVSAWSRNNRLEIQPWNTCLFPEAGEPLPPQRLCNVSERWVTACACSTSFLLSQPPAPAKERTGLSHSTCDAVKLIPGTLKTLHSAIVLGRKKQTDKISLKEKQS